MLKVVKFRMDHLDNFQCRDAASNLREDMLENFMDAKRDMVALVNSSGVTVCIAGVNHLRLGVGEGWILGGEHIEQHKFEFFKQIRALIDFLFQYMGLHRFEIAIDFEWEGGRKWAEKIGLKFEGVNRAYDFRMRDHAIFTRIGKWQQEPPSQP